MKRNFARFRSLALAAGLLAASGLGNLCLAQVSPVGTWDCVISGHRDGTAYIVFSTNGTFTCYEVIVPKRTAPASAASRGVQGGRGDTSSSSPGNTGTQIFGGEVQDGPWGFDSKNRVIGYFIETSTLEDCKTNAFPYSTTPLGSSTDPTPITNGNPFDLTYCVDAPYSTNVVGTTTNYLISETCYTNIVTCDALTNGISFVGKATGGRLTLTCSTPFGKTVYRGVPARTLPDLSGNWYGTKTQNKIAFQEFLTLTPTVVPNVYTAVGGGPGYSYGGWAILSSQKKISFAFGMLPPLPTDPVTVVRAVTGPINLNSLTANTRGWDQPGFVFTNTAVFKAAKSP